MVDRLALEAAQEKLTELADHCERCAKFATTPEEKAHFRALAELNRECAYNLFLKKRGER